MNERWFLSLEGVSKLTQLVDLMRTFGAGEAIRTPDPNLGKVMLYP